MVNLCCDVIELVVVEAVEMGIATNITEDECPQVVFSVLTDFHNLALDLKVQ